MATFSSLFGGLLVGALTVSTALATPFETMLTAAYQSNQSLNASHQEWQAKQHNADAAGFLPDPMISYDYFSTTIETRTGPQRQRVMLEQKLPWFGTRALQSSEKQHQAQANYWQWQAAQLQLQSQLGQLYGQLYYWNASTTIAKGNLKLLQELASIVQSRYQVAAATQPDWIRIQVEVGRAQDRLLSLEQQAPALAQQLVQLIGTSEFDDLQLWPHQLPLDELNVAMVASNESQAKHPALQQMAQMQAAANTTAELAENRYRPDVSLRYGRLFTGEAMDPSMPGSGKDPEYVGVSLNIPLWWKQYNAQRQAALSQAQSIQFQTAYASQQLKTQWQQGWYLWQDNLRRMQLYRDDLIPRLESALETQLRAYQTGNGGFHGLLDIEKQLLELELVKAQAEQQCWNAYHTMLLASGQAYSNSKSNTGEKP